MGQSCIPGSLGILVGFRIFNVTAAVLEDINYSFFFGGRDAQIRGPGRSPEVVAHVGVPFARAETYNFD